MTKRIDNGDTTEDNTRLSDLRYDIGMVSESVKYIKEKVEKIEEKLEKDYVTQEAFAPVKNVVYGLVGLILVAVIVAVLALVIRK
jgi:hypothetical protein